MKMKPTYLLDENLHYCYGEKPRSFYINAKEIIGCGKTDDLLLREATKRGLTIITPDKGFVLEALTQNHDIIYEDQNGDRYFISGKSCKLIDKNCKKPTMVLRKKVGFKIIKKLNRVLPPLPYNGFYMVSFL